MLLVFTLAGFFAFGSGLGGAGLCKLNIINYIPPIKNGLQCSAFIIKQFATTVLVYLLQITVQIFSEAEKAERASTQHKIYITDNLRNWYIVHITKKTCEKTLQKINQMQVKWDKVYIPLPLHHPQHPVAEGDMDGGKNNSWPISLKW